MSVQPEESIASTLLPPSCVISWPCGLCLSLIFLRNSPEKLWSGIVSASLPQPNKPFPVKASFGCCWCRLHSDLPPSLPEPPSAPNLQLNFPEMSLSRDRGSILVHPGAFSFSELVLKNAINKWFIEQLCLTGNLLRRFWVFCWVGLTPCSPSSAGSVSPCLWNQHSVPAQGNQATGMRSGLERRRRNPPFLSLNSCWPRGLAGCD